MSAEPLKLADALGRVTTCPDVHSAHCPVILDAAAELHRLHAEVTRLGIREAADVEEIGRLHAENERLKTVMIAAAEEISEHWEAHCDAEGYGPANLMHRLENGIASEYGYTAGAFAKLKADNSRLQATLDAAVAAARAEERALTKEQIDYPREVFGALIDGNSPYAFYLFQWVPYQTDAQRWRLKMKHDVRTFDGREAHGIWPNGSHCGPFRDDEVEFIRISRRQWGEEWADPRPPRGAAAIRDLKPEGE